jgi:hypothetical protein
MELQKVAGILSTDEIEISVGVDAAVNPSK